MRSTDAAPSRMRDHAQHQLCHVVNRSATSASRPVITGTVDGANGKSSWRPVDAFLGVCNSGECARRRALPHCCRELEPYWAAPPCSFGQRLFGNNNPLSPTMKGPHTSLRGPNHLECTGVPGKALWRMLTSGRCFGTCWLIQRGLLYRRDINQRRRQRIGSTLPSRISMDGNAGTALAFCRLTQSQWEAHHRTRWW